MNLHDPNARSVRAARRNDERATEPVALHVMAAVGVALALIGVLASTLLVVAGALIAAVSVAAASGGHRHPPRAPERSDDLERPDHPSR